MMEHIWVGPTEIHWEGLKVNLPVFTDRLRQFDGFRFTHVKGTVDHIMVNGEGNIININRFNEGIIFSTSMTKSRMWPHLCVGWETCWIKPILSRLVLNRFTSDFSGQSKCTLKSPRSKNFLAKYLNSQWNYQTLREKVHLWVYSYRWRVGSVHQDNIQWVWHIRDDGKFKGFKVRKVKICNLTKVKLRFIQDANTTMVVISRNTGYIDDCIIRGRKFTDDNLVFILHPSLC